jgi:hypothetical protein
VSTAGLANVVDHKAAGGHEGGVGRVVIRGEEK